MNTRNPFYTLKPVVSYSQEEIKNAAVVLARLQITVHRSKNTKNRLRSAVVDSIYKETEETAV